MMCLIFHHEILRDASTLEYIIIEDDKTRF